MSEQKSLTTANETTVGPAVAAPLAYAPHQERDKALRRFNWLTIYLPLIVATLLALAALGVLGWFALAGEPASMERMRASGIADFFLALVCLAPLSLIGAAFAGGGLFFLYWRRKKGSLLRERIQRILRKSDQRLDAADTRARVEQARVVQNTIRYRNQFEAFIDKLYLQLAQVAKWINEKLARNKD